MPRLEETENPASDNEHGWMDSFDHVVGDRVSGFWEAFTNFALRDNVLEVAIGLM